MLNRLVTLSTQAANKTYSSTDTGNIQKEADALVAEIKRIEDDTKFNGQAVFGAAYDFQVSEDSKITMASVTKLSASFTSVTPGSAAIKTLKTHINTVSQSRAALGATQNRLEHTVNNLGVTMENLQNAESTIRDTNIADEMMAYTKNSILMQSAQAMLAQANQVPQGVLQLMQ